MGGEMAAFLILEAEAEAMHELSISELDFFIERLDSSMEDLINYYKQEDTTNFDRGLIVNMLDKIDQFKSDAEDIQGRLTEEENERKRREKEAEEERKKRRLPIIDEDMEDKEDEEE